MTRRRASTKVSYSKFFQGATDKDLDDFEEDSVSEFGVEDDAQSIASTSTKSLSEAAISTDDGSLIDAISHTGSIRSDNGSYLEDEDDNAPDLDSVQKAIDASLSHLFQQYQTEGDKIVSISIQADLNGRILCPVPGCSKDFKGAPSLKYHLLNHKHSISDLFSVYSKGNYELARSIIEKAEFEMRKYAKIIDTQTRYHFCSDSMKLSIETPLKFYLDERTSSLNNLNTSCASTDTSVELALLKKVVNAGLSSLLVPRTAKRKKHKRKHQQESVIESNTCMVLPCITDELKWQCPIAGCAKPLSTVPSVRYHFAHHEHDGKLLLEKFKPQISEYLSLDEITCFEDEDFLNRAICSFGLEHPSIESQQILFEFPNAESFFSCSVIFAFGSSKGKRAQQQQSPSSHSSAPKSIRHPLIEVSAKALTQDLTIIDNDIGFRSPSESINVSVNDIKRQIEPRTSILIDDAAYINPSGFISASTFVDYQGSKIYFACAVHWSTKITDESFGEIQIWAADDSLSSAPSFIYSICHSYGRIIDMKVFCARFADEAVHSTLLITSRDGYFRLLILPSPSTNAVSKNIRIKPNIEVKYVNGRFTKICPSQSGLVALGTDDGTIQLWNIKDFLNQKSDAKSPAFSIRAHDSSIVSLCWLGVDKIIVSSGLDSRILLTDIRLSDGITEELTRTRDFCNCVTYLEETESILFHHDNIVKAMRPSESITKTVQLSFHGDIVWHIVKSLALDVTVIALCDGTVETLVLPKTLSRKNKPKVAFFSKTTVETSNDGEEINVIFEISKGTKPLQKQKKQTNVFGEVRPSTSLYASIESLSSFNFGNYQTKVRGDVLLTSLTRGLLKLEKIEI